MNETFCVAAILVGLALTPSFVVAQVERDWTGGDLAQLVSDDQSRIEQLPAFETEWIVYEGPLEIHADDPAGSSEPDLASMQEAARAELVWSNGTFRLAYTGAGGRSVVQTWDGTNGAQSTFEGAHVEFGQPFAPPDDRAFLHLLNGMEEVGRLRHKLLSEILREGVGAQQSTSGDVLTWRCVPPSSTGFYREFDIDLAERRLVRVSDVFLVSDKSEQARLRVDRVIDRWEVHNGHALATRGQVLVSSNTPDGVTTPDGRMYVKRFTYVRKGLQFPENPPEITIELRSDAAVNDPRLGLKFRVGQSRLSIDGQQYETAEPIWAHPGDNLPALLASAKIVTISQTASESRRFGGLVAPALVGLLVAAGILAAIYVMRRRTWTKVAE